MKTILSLTAAILLSKMAIAAVPNLKQILSIRPGEQFSQVQKKVGGLKSSSAVKGADYEIQLENDIIQSVKIDFKQPVAFDEYLKSETKGYCLVQPMPGDVGLNRIFFFDMDKQSRYEITATGKIKSILIQDIPGARSNKECQFSEVFQLEKSVNKVKKVK